MPIDTGLYSDIGQPVQAVNKLASIFDPSVIQARNLDVMQKQNALQDLLDTQKARDVYSKMTPNASLHDVANQLYAAGAIKPAAEARNAAIAQDKAKLDAAKTLAETGQAQSKASLNQTQATVAQQALVRDFASRALSNPTDDNLWGVLRLNGVPEDQHDAAIASLPKDVEGRKNYLMGLVRTPDQTVAQNTPKPVIVNAGGAQIPGVQNPVTGAVTPAGAAIQTTPSASAQLAAETSRRNTDVTNQTRRDLASARQVATNSMSDDAVEQAATQYRMTGQLPALGNGGAAVKARILNRAADQAKADGNGGQEQAIRQAAYKGASTALANLTKQQNMVGSFEKTAQQNLDLALQLSDKVDRTNSPIINRGLIAFKNGVQGDADTAAFVNALTAARTEYAKVLSGATGATGVTDSARKEADELFSTATSPETLRKVIATAKQEMGNRTKAFEDQKAELTQSMRLPAAPTATPPANRPPLSSFSKL